MQISTSRKKIQESPQKWLASLTLPSSWPHASLAVGPFSMQLPVQRLVDAGIFPTWGPDPGLVLKSDTGDPLPTTSLGVENPRR